MGVPSQHHPHKSRFGTHIAHGRVLLGRPQYLALAVLLGGLVGLIGTAFHVVADGALRLHVHIAETFSFWTRLGFSAALSAAMVLLALFIVRQFAMEAGGSGIDEVEGAMAGRRPLRWKRILPVKFVGGVLAIGSGLVVGREGPTIHMGAAVSAALSDRVEIETHERKGLIAAGAAAGLATAFSAPVAAVLFVMEETRREFPHTFLTFAAVIVASLISAVVTAIFLGTGPDLAVELGVGPHRHFVHWLLLGIVMGVVGVAFNKTLIWTVGLFQAIHHNYILAGLVGACVGLILAIDPGAVRGGEGLIQHLVQERTALSLLLFLVLVRFATTMLSYAISVPGGLFAPILTLAAAIGLAYGNFVNAISPEGWQIDPAASAVAAMAGLFAGAVRAPVVGVVLIAELTGTFQTLPMLLTTAIVAHITAEFLGGKPIYSQLLARKLLLERRQRLAAKAKSDPV
ncbi:MAG: H(+)/Cl(-) exchange transporter ClcA [Devosia sp.]